MSGPITLYAFDGGRITASGVRFIDRSGQDALRDMADPNHCYLIRHPDGLLMWDSGLPDAIHGLPGHTLEKGRFRFTVERTLAAQMEAIGAHPESVQQVAFSHLQIDHAGNAGLFPHAAALLQAAEHRMAFGRSAAKWGYVRADYASLAGRVQKLKGDHDVFGDGRVMILSAPGHTPGHQVLYVELARSGPVLLTGDLYYAEGDAEAGWMPAWNVDHEQTRATMERMEAFARLRGARWIYNHQPGPPAVGWME